MKNNISCSTCGGYLDKVPRAGKVLLLCRPCKLPHDEHGNPLFSGHSLSDRFNPLQAARDTLKKSDKTSSGVTRVAMETALMQGMLDAYFAGVKDGVLLAYSQEHEEGEPMEKLGVSNEELKKELTDKYNELLQKSSAILTKEAAAANYSEIEAVKAKLDELNAQG